MSHSILLIQPTNQTETRTYSDYESVNDCLEGVCRIYEEHLKRRNPNTVSSVIQFEFQFWNLILFVVACWIFQPTITYDISQLFDFIDQLKDLSVLVYQKSTNTYAPYGKEWIKEKIYVLLRKAAGTS